MVVYALELECGHEAFALAKRVDPSPPSPERARCPIFWSCQLNDGRTAIRYVEASGPQCEDAKFGLARWSVALACGHTGVILRDLGTDESRVGDFLVCWQCGQDDPYFDAEIVALGTRLPDLLVQNWTVELDCGHRGTDYFIPVEFAEDPAGYRAKNPRRRGLRCINSACDERAVQGVRRLGVLGKIRASKRAAEPFDPVATTARDLRRRLTREEREALIRELQRDW